MSINLNIKTMIQKILITILFLFSAYFTTTNYSNCNYSSDKNIKYIAYYFHRTGRCTACLNLEAFTKELIENKFSKKNFSFISINVDEEENEHFIKDYNLEFSSVVLVKIKNDQQLKWKSMDSVWSFANDKDKFFEYAEKEIKYFIKN